jgi:protein ImuB
MTQPAEIYACVYVREFPAQALLRLRPELREKPCVVMEGDPPLQEVCALTKKARQLGLVCGMTRVEVDTFPGVTVLSRSRGEEAATRSVLLECAGCFSPRVENCSKENAFLCVIDIAGTQGLFGPPETLAQSLLTRIGSQRITPSITVCSNFHAAIALAKGLPSRSVQVICPGEESKTLASLPLTVLDLSAEQCEMFALWGIRSLGMLGSLPEKELIARMGQPGQQIRQQARGQMPHLFQPVEPPFNLEEYMELDSPIEVLDALMFVANVMLEKMILRATARALALASVRIRLELEGSATHSRTVRPALPTNDRPLWIKLLHLDLESHPPQSAILAVTLDAEPGKASKQQLGLFSPQLPEPSRLDVTLARISAIVGEGNCGRAVLTDTHQLDAFLMEPFRVPSAKSSEIQPGPLRPSMRRLRPSEPISITMQSESPRTFFFRDRRYSVEQAYGPWMSSGEWWSATLWGSEQWDLIARAHDGTTICCCVIRDLLRDQWQMVALYD